MRVPSGDARTLGTHPHCAHTMIFVSILPCSPPRMWTGKDNARPITHVTDTWDSNLTSLPPCHSILSKVSLVPYLAVTFLFYMNTKSSVSSLHPPV